MMPDSSYSYFCNRDCEFFPCHKGADKKHFNCLFCFCPLYALGARCGGNYKYLDSGIKDCSECLLPHSKGGYEFITTKFELLAKLAGEDRA